MTTHRKKTVILFPTLVEAHPFMNRCPSTAEVRICGMGITACAACTAATLTDRRPDMIVLAGVAGAYTDSGLHKGDCVMIEREYLADMGTMRGGRFVPLPVAGDTATGNYYDNPTPLPAILPAIHSDTVSVAGTPLRAPRLGTSAENMEGAGFFAICEALGARYAQIRAISNHVGEERRLWTIDTAAEHLADAIEKLLAAI